MNRRLVLFPSATIAAATLVACVTVNVYFPAAEIKDLSRKIEQEVQKQAARNQAENQGEDANTPGSQQAPQPNAEPDEKPQQRGAGTVGLLDTLLGVTPVYAQGGKVAEPDVTSPAIRKIIDSRAARVDALNKYRTLGVIGENNQALLEIRKLDALTDLKERAEVQKLVKGENADREELFREIAVAKKVDPSQIPKIRETYAATLREMARPGDWIQTADGAWKQK